MRAVVQRVKEAAVSVNDEQIAKIGKGMTVFVGIAAGDTIKDVDYIAEKIVGLRIFEDDEGKMNKSIQDIDGEILMISQFTLLGDVRKGRRPSFTQAALPDEAQKLYEALVDACNQKVKTKKGQFQAQMLVYILNDGPVTILVDSNKNF